MARVTERSGALCLLPVVPVPDELRQPMGCVDPNLLAGSVEDILISTHWATCDLSWHAACARALAVLDELQPPACVPPDPVEIDEACGRFALTALQLRPPGRPPVLPPGHAQAHVHLVYNDADDDFAAQWAAALSDALTARCALGAVRRATTAIEVDSAHAFVCCVLSEAFAQDAHCESLLQISIMRQRQEGGTLLSVADAAVPLPASCPRYIRLQPRLRLVRVATAPLEAAAALFADALVTRLRLRELGSALAGEEGAVAQRCAWAETKTVLVVVGERDAAADRLSALWVAARTKS
ncbi:hypothetical protein T492DRAFT_303227 [Pavlovales sp. CCMP2436]|nr:hypothetical protein T492DRAFT_303227 [Pavlovales sp. CCMP2436]